MLYFVFNERNALVNVTPEAPRDLPAGHREVTRHDLADFAAAELLAEQATAWATGQTDDTYIPVDNGAHCWPRFDVVRLPRIGEPVSYSFNGDSYPCGQIVAISPTYGVITAREGNGRPLRFHRVKLTGGWRQGGTWWLISGHHNERNPHL